jgi:hypothetical protein
MFGQGKMKFKPTEQAMPKGPAIPPMGEEKESSPGVMNKGASKEEAAQLVTFSDDTLKAEMEKRGFMVSKTEDEEDDTAESEDSPTMFGG